MNILVLSSYYPAVSNPVSGIFVQGQVQALARKGCRVKVIAPIPLAPFPLPYLSKKWAGYHQMPRSERDGNIEVYHPRYLSLPRNWSFAKAGQRMYAGVKRLLAEITEEFAPDLIHAHAALPAGDAALRAGADYKVPYLVTVHGGDLQRTIDFNQACKRAVGEVFFESAAVILVSNKLKRIAKERFGEGANYLVIPNGIDPAYLEKFSHRQGTSGGSGKTILSISNLYPAKGIDLNLQAVGRLVENHPDLKYQIIGVGPERGFLMNLTRELGISDQVEFLGQLPHDQAMSAMAACDVYSLPSWQEGFGITYLEAMALGKPVIGCLGQGIEDFVVDGESGFLVKPRAVEDLVSVLRDLLDDPERGTQVGTRAQKMVLKNYTWKKNAREMVRIYQDILNP